MWRALVLVPLCGCTLTEALWAPSGKVLHDVSYERVECEVVGVRGELRRSAGDTRLAVELVPVGDASALPHTTLWNEERPGRLLLRPPSNESCWWFASPAFRPDGWDFDVFGGAVFKARGSFNARVEMWGVVEPEALASEMPVTPDLPAQPASAAVPPEWEWRSRLALAEHDWGWLLTGRRGVAVRPRAWVDASGVVLESLAHRTEPGGCALVVELGEEPRWFEIPAAILACSYEQQLVRTDRGVEWRYESVWWARHGGDDSLSAFAAPLRASTIDYEWGYQQPMPRRPLWKAVKIVLTPIAAALDVVIYTSPALRRFVRELLGLPVPVDPGRKAR